MRSAGRGRMCIMRVVVAWVGAVVFLAGSVLAGVAIANATVFSASGFVRDYLGALAAGRVDEVLALPGIDAEGLDGRMLDPRAVQGFDWTVGADEERGGVHRVTVEFHASGTSGRAVLEVERVGTRFGLFPAWGFATSPVTPLTVTTSGDARFTAGGLPVELDGGRPTTFAVLTPGVYRLSHDSAFLSAEPVTVAATGRPASATLAIEPDAAFRDAAQRALDTALQACATQQVLFPTGCPFGYAIDNRVASVPRWTIARLPDAVLEPADHLGLWQVRAAPGLAHLSVEVQSLFDGSVSTLEKDVPFEADYLVGFDGDAVAVVPLPR